MKDEIKIPRGFRRATMDEYLGAPLDAKLWWDRSHEEWRFGRAHVPAHLDPDQLAVQESILPRNCPLCGEEYGSGVRKSKCDCSPLERGGQDEVPPPPPRYARCSKAYWERCREDERLCLQEGNYPASSAYWYPAEQHPACSPAAYACRLPAWIECPPPDGYEICTVPEAKATAEWAVHVGSQGVWESDPGELEIYTAQHFARKITESAS